MTRPKSSLSTSAWRIGLFAAGAGLLASAAAAQPAPTPLAPVAVQAPQPAVVKKDVRSFVQAYTARSGKIDQIPRWHQPVCVDVRGLVAGDAAKVSARIEDVAKSIGLKALPHGCQANIEVIFTDQPQRMADTIGEAYLGFHYQSDIKKTRAVTHPIQGWYATATTGNTNVAGLMFSGGASASGGSGGTAKGPDSADTNSAWQSNFGQNGGTQLSMSVVDSPDHATPTGCADSRFSSCLKSNFMNVLLIADNHAIEGKDVGAITDYLVMLALSQPKTLDGCTALPSVLDLLAPAACPGREPPTGLTPSDAAYLTSLYASDPEARTTSAEGDIADHMTKILIKAQAAH